MTFVERLAQIRCGARPAPTRVTPFIHVDFEAPPVRKLLELTAPRRRPVTARTAIYDLASAAAPTALAIEQHPGGRRVSTVHGEE